MQMQRQAGRQTFKKYSGLILKYQDPDPYKLNIRKYQKWRRV
jgi:hypothetical protein